MAHPLAYEYQIVSATTSCHQVIRRPAGTQGTWEVVAECKNHELAGLVVLGLRAAWTLTRVQELVTDQPNLEGYARRPVT